MRAAQAQMKPRTEHDHRALALAARHMFLKIKPRGLHSGTAVAPLPL